MKKLFALFLILPLFSANAAEKTANTKMRGQDKSAQTKIYRQHQKNWRQRTHAQNIVLFKCNDSWGHRIRGKFTGDEQYFIELGGGSCSKVKRQHRAQVNLSALEHRSLPIDSVYRVIERIKNNYGLKKVRFVKAKGVSNGYKTFKYTLVFESKRHHKRKFKVRQNRWTGNVHAIHEV